MYIYLKLKLRYKIKKTDRPTKKNNDYTAKAYKMLTSVAKDFAIEYATTNFIIWQIHRCISELSGHIDHLRRIEFHIRTPGKTTSSLQRLKKS